MVLANLIEYIIRFIISHITNYFPVKVIRDDRGVPFLYRYHLFALTNDGPGMCIHRFVKSDPDRGYHDHPWSKALSFILCGGYEERIYSKDSPTRYKAQQFKRWNFNYLNGNNFHRVMIEENKDAWTLFAFGKRSKTWGMISLDDQYKPMSTTISDQDGGWWNHVMKGLGLHEHLEHPGKVIATVDTIIIATLERKILLIKRAKDPYKDCWAFPGGRIEQKDANIELAAYRELSEETGIFNVRLDYRKTVGNNTRDPRGFCLTNVFIGRIESVNEVKVRAGDDAIDYQWFDLDELPVMAFDHGDILKSVQK